MKFAVEPLAQCWDEMIALAALHWKETEGYRHGQPFAPKLERYKQYDDMGWYFEGTARDDDGKLVGYCGMYIVPSMHSQCQIAVEDSLFIVPEHRKGRNAIRFIKFLEDECRRRGVVEISITAKNEGVGKILQYLDFSLTAWQYSKQIPTMVRADSPLERQVETVDVPSSSAA